MKRLNSVAVNQFNVCFPGGASDEDFDPTEDAFGLAFDIDMEGAAILRDYLQLLSASHLTKTCWGMSFNVYFQFLLESALTVFNISGSSRVSKFGELLSVNLDDPLSVAFLWCISIRRVLPSRLHPVEKCMLNLLMASSVCGIHQVRSSA